jgi:hypothetical protein
VFLAKLCEDYGVPYSCTSEGAEPHCQGGGGYDERLCIHHKISSVANPHTKARAELRVKTVKRMLNADG